MGFASRPLYALALIVFFALPAVAQQDDDWEVVTPAWKKQAERLKYTYDYISTQVEWDQAFQKAFDKNDERAARYLLGLVKKKNLTFDINAPHEEGRTLLHQSATRDSAAMTSLLLEFGANINAADERGNTPLHAAVGSRSMKNIKKLAATSGIDLNAENRSGERVLGLALAARNDDAVKELMRYSPELTFKVGGVELAQWVIKRDNLTGFKLLYRSSNFKNLTLDAKGSTLLHNAAAAGATNIAAYLLKHDADPFTLNKGKQPAFDAAILNGHLETFKAFVKADRKILTYRDPQTGDTLLHRALSMNDPELIDYVLAQKPSLTAVNTNKETVLDAVRKIRPLLDAKNVELVEKFENYEKQLAKKGATYEKLSTQALENEDVAQFKNIIRYAHSNDVNGWLQTLVEARKTKLIKTLLQEYREHFTKDGSPVFFRLELYHPQNWDLFKAVYEGLDGEGFDDPPNFGSIREFALSADIEFLKKAMTLEPPIDFNIKGTPSRRNYNEPPPYALDFYEADMREKAFEWFLPLDKINSTIPHQKSKREELEARRDLLIKWGAFTGEEKKKLIETLKKLLKEDKGFEILESYDVKRLSKVREVFEYAIVHDDLKLAAALLKQGRHAPINSELQPVVTLQMRKLLNKYGMKLPETVACNRDFSTLSTQGPKLATRWILSTRLAHCTDLAEVLVSMVNFRKSFDEKDVDKIFDAALSTSQAKEALNTLAGVSRSTPLHLAVNQCLSSLVEKFLEKGANPNGTDKSGWVALTYNSSSGSPTGPCEDRTKILKLLLDAGTDPNATGPGETTLLASYTKNKASPEMIGILLDAGADPYRETRNEYGYKNWNAFDHAVKTGDLETIKVFIDKDVNPLHPRSCSTIADDRFSEFSNTANDRDRMNTAIKLYRARQKKEAAGESCDAVKQRVETEYIEKLTAVGENLAQLEKAMQAPKKKTQPLCCGISSTKTPDCRAHLFCDKHVQNKNRTEPFCEFFNDAKNSETLRFAIETKEKQPTIARLEHGLAGAEPTVELSMRLPLENDMPKIYEKLHLNSLYAYVAWKYPRCVGSYINETKLTERRAVKQQNDEANPEISPHHTYRGSPAK